MNVVIKGTSTGTVSDLDGQYRIEVPSSESVLVFSSIGFTSREVALGGRSVIDLTLAPDVTALDEVVVVDYCLDQDPVPDIYDPEFPVGWTNFYRRDDWSSTAYFYLDRWTGLRATFLNCSLLNKELKICNK